MACGRATLVILLLSSIVGATLAQNEAETIDLMEFVPDQSVPESASTQDAQDAGKEVSQAEDDATEDSKNANAPNDAQKIEEAHDGLSDMIEADKEAQIRELGRKKLLKKGSQKPNSFFPKKIKSVKGEDKKAEWLARRKQGEERRALKKAERQEKKANFLKMQAEKKGTWSAILQKKEPALTQVIPSAEKLSNTNDEESEASNIIPPGDDAMSGGVTVVAEKENIAASEGSSSPKLIKFSNKQPKLLGKEKSNKPKKGGFTKKEGALKTLNRKSMKVVKGLPGWQKKEGTLAVKTPEEKKLQMQQKKEEWKAKKAEKMEKKRALQNEKKKTATTQVEIPELPVTAEGLISNASKDYPQLKLSEEYFLLKKAMKEITVNATLAQYIAVKAFIDPQDLDLGWRPEIVNALSARFLLFNDDLAAKIESAENPDVKNALFKFWLKHVCVQQMIINNALIGKTQKNEWKSLIESIQTSTVPENSILRDPNA